MKKLFTFGIWIVLLFVVVSSTAQRRYFYSLKYVKVGQNNVRPPYSAGMYVTFPASKDGKYICYDSDRNGYAVNASFKLDYIGNNQKLIHIMDGLIGDRRITISRGIIHF